MAREARDMRERRNPKFEVRGSKFRKPRTLNIEPLLVSLGYAERTRSSQAAQKARQQGRR
jgi:hypothetical protein